MNKMKRMFGMCVVFKDDKGAGDANNPDIIGGANNDKSGGGVGGSDDKGQKKAETYEIKVDGESRNVTLDELKELASKAGGADEKFRLASELKKQGETGIRTAELIKSLDAAESPNETEVKELAVLLGMEAGEIMSGLKTSAEEDEKKSAEGLSKEQTIEALKALGIDPEELKATQAYSKQRHIADARKELREISDQAVDKDEVFGKMIIGEHKEDRLSVIKDLVSEDYFGKIEHGETHGAELLAASIQKVRAHLVRFGISSKPDLAPIVLGSGPGGVLPAEVQSDEPIKRISVFDQGGEDNVISRYYQKAVKLAREKLS